VGNILKLPKGEVEKVWTLALQLWWARHNRILDKYVIGPNLIKIEAFAQIEEFGRLMKWNTLRNHRPKLCRLGSKLEETG